MGRESGIRWIVFGIGVGLVGVLATGCTGGGSAGDETAVLQLATAESCMQCHNASLDNDYSGPGIENPHPFAGANNLLCTTCHGGNPNGVDRPSSHVPPPPEIGDDQNLIQDRTAYFNRLTLTGIDKYADYIVGGQTYSAIDYLQFINPGDLRVVTQGRSCGQCHAGHVDCVEGSLLATEAGILSGATFAAGMENAVPESAGRYQDTAADFGFRQVNDLDHDDNTAQLGAVARLLEFPVISVRGETGGDNLFQSNLYLASNLPAGQDADNSLIAGSPLANLWREQVAFTCGDCHLGSAGANNRYGDYRSSGCTACHMPYSLDGRSRSSDPNVNKFEPLDPDDIEAPERSHPRSHQIISVARESAGGGTIQGIDDYACAGCHQGSNRTVMQYWGIRLDQNQDVRRGDQYPANPVSYQNTNGDTRLFDPVVGNNTFNGRNHNQYLRFEDYDGDGRDDTPADVHYEAGLGCIDCHGSGDLHGGDPTQPGREIKSRQEQSVAITCESCHGPVDAYAPTITGTAHDGQQRELAVDGRGNPMKHVVKEDDGHYYLYSKLTGDRHYVKQTMDTVVDKGRSNTITGDPVFSAKASYAMGRDDGNSATGIGPKQTPNSPGDPPSFFSHTDDLSCAACHSSWTNSCIGCHLEGEYNTGNNFSNITGQRIAFREKVADFVYQTPLHFQLGVNTKDEIAPISANTDTFFRYEDRFNDRSEVFAFSDRNNGGNNPSVTHPALSHNVLMPHSIRGKVSSLNEGPRYCNACHLTDAQLVNFGTEYDTFRTAMATNDYASLDFDLLKQHIGQNPNNQLDSPLWVHMVSGLGTGLYLFDENGSAVNPLDDNDNRAGSEGTSPADVFLSEAFGNVAFNVDRIVLTNGQSTGSNNHPMTMLSTMRDGNVGMSGPLGATLIQRLSDPTAGIVLNSWIDADGNSQGDAATHLGGP